MPPWRQGERSRPWLAQRVATVRPEGSLWPVLISLCLCLASAVGCRGEGSEEPPGEPEPTPAATAPRLLDAGLDPLSSASPAPTSSAPKGPSRLDPLLRELRERRLTLGHREVAEQRMAFTSDRLAVLGTDEVVVRDLQTFEIVLRPPLEGPRSIIALRDGSFLVVGKLGSLRILPQRRAVEPLPHLPLFGDSQLLPDRRTSDRAWLQHPFSPELYGYRLQPSASRVAALDKLVPLEGFDRRALLGLKDGSFIFTAQDRWVRFWLFGAPEVSSPSPLGRDLWRLLLARRLDQFWVARRDGHLELVQIGPDYLAQGSFDLGANLFDIASGDQWVAALRVDEPANQPRRWSLVVVDTTGKELLKADLPPDPAPIPGENWVEPLVRNRQLAFCDTPPRLAVGGPDHLMVWDLEKLSLLFGASSVEQRGH